MGFLDFILKGRLWIVEVDISIWQTNHDILTIVEIFHRLDVNAILFIFLIRDALNSVKNFHLFEFYDIQSTV